MPINYSFEKIMDEGYILSNKFRATIFESVAKGETDIYTIAKRQHILLSISKRIAEDLVKKGYFEKKGNRYFLTKEGEKIASKIV